MKDLYGRPVKSIRISVNTTCNLNCYYCHNEGQGNSTLEMRPEEIERILYIAKKIGITKVKFTGGEPLLRKDIVDIVQKASNYMDDVSITTNGTLLKSFAKDLRAAGLDRINVSLDCLDKEQYKGITGKDLIDDVIEGIKESVAVGMYPVKVNIVSSQKTLQDVLDSIQAVWKMNATPQLIELVDVNKELYVDISEIEQYISENAVDVKERSIHNRKVYMMNDEEGEIHPVEIVRPMHNTEFCAKCTRIRVTSDGKLKPCLMHNNGLIDILTPIRLDAEDQELIELFYCTIKNRVPCWS